MIPATPPLCDVTPASPADEPLARQVAAETGFPLMAAPRPGRWAIHIKDGQLYLYPPEAGLIPLTIDFSAGALTYRRQHGGGKKQAVARAAGVTSKHKPSILDATAGWGEDAFILASLGCEVTMVERHPVIALLLAYALQRAQASENQEIRTIASRMQCHHGDIRHGEEAGSLFPPLSFDVVYLDPMFPARKKSALVKKDMRLLKMLVGTDEDAGGLLPAALAIARKRVVVKRPAQAPFLAEQSPSHQITGKANRFDVYHPL